MTSSPGVPATEPARAESDQRYQSAVDWLLNNAELDTQALFWAYVDAKVTREELDRFTMTDLVEREAALGLEVSR